MHLKPRLFFAPLFLILAGLACNLPSNIKSAPQADATLSAFYTAAAQTVQAAESQAAPLSTSTPASAPSPTSAPIPSNTPQPVALCDAAAFVKDVTVPDGTAMGRGAVFTKTWRVQNMGVCSWTTSYALVFVGGDQMSAPAGVIVPGVVNPGETVDLSVTMTAPGRDGRYKGYWKLRNAAGILFGIGPQAQDPFWADIAVTGPVYAAYDFTAHVCDAAWDNNIIGLPCPGVNGDSNGYVLKLDHPVMENGRTEDRAGLLTVPQNAYNGSIRGKYPAFTVSNGDRFQALMNCQYQAYSCDVYFRLEYQANDGVIRTLGQWHEVYEGQFSRADIDLSALAGQNVQFALKVIANGWFNQDYALWIAPRIVRNGTPPPTFTPTFTPTPTSTSTAAPTNTPTPTSTP